MEQILLPLVESDLCIDLYQAIWILRICARDRMTVDNALSHDYKVIMLSHWRGSHGFPPIFEVSTTPENSHVLPIYPHPLRTVSILIAPATKNFDQHINNWMEERSCILIKFPTQVWFCAWGKSSLLLEIWGWQPQPFSFDKCRECGLEGTCLQLKWEQKELWSQREVEEGSRSIYQNTWNGVISQQTNKGQKHCSVFSDDLRALLRRIIRMNDKCPRLVVNQSSSTSCIICLITLPGHLPQQASHRRGPPSTGSTP